MTDKLEDGFYWVRPLAVGMWIIMERMDGCWWECVKRSAEPDEIDPRPIKRGVGE